MLTLVKKSYVIKGGFWEKVRRKKQKLSNMKKDKVPGKENHPKLGHGQHIHFEINSYNRKNGRMVATDVFALKAKLEKLRK